MPTRVTPSEAVSALAHITSCYGRVSVPLGWVTMCRAAPSTHGPLFCVALAQEDMTVLTH